MAAYDELRGEWRERTMLVYPCWADDELRTQMPIVVSCGHWNKSGWFLQWLGNRWRWHVGGVL